MRKPRSDSVIQSLEPAQREQVKEWLSDKNLSYKETAAKIAEEFGIKTSAGALQSWFVRFERPRQYAAAKGAADEFAALMDGQWTSATLKLAQQLAFELLSSPTPAIGAAKTLFKIIGDSAKLEIAREKVGLDARKVAVLEQRAALATAAEDIAKDAKATDEQKTERLKQVFGLR